jgi:uncharacterized membrane protein
MLAKYNEIIPDGAERIVAMAERQSAHRQSLEKRVVNSNTRNELLGQIFGFVISMTVVVGGFVLISQGKNVTGISAVLGSLAALVGVFALGKRKQQNELQNKAKNN